MPSLITAIFSPRMLVALIMGFACGLPLLLTISLLQAWMKQVGVDIFSVIGLMSLVGLPYTLKFLWAPPFRPLCPPRSWAAGGAGF